MVEVVKWKVSPPLGLQGRHLRINSSQLIPLLLGFLASVNLQVKIVQRTTSRANLDINNGF